MLTGVVIFAHLPSWRASRRPETFLTNGPSVFLTFEEAWKSKEEPRSAMTWQAQGAEASSKLPRCIFSEWSLHFHHFEARKDVSWSLRCRNHCNVCQKLATPETRKTQGPFANSGSWGLLGASWGPLGGLLGAWLQGGLLEASWGPPGGPLGPSKSCCKNWGFQTKGQFGLQNTGETACWTS